MNVVAIQEQELMQGDDPRVLLYTVDLFPNGLAAERVRFTDVRWPEISPLTSVLLRRTLMFPRMDPRTSGEVPD